MLQTDWLDQLSPSVWMGQASTIEFDRRNKREREKKNWEKWWREKKMPHKIVIKKICVTNTINAIKTTERASVRAIEWEINERPHAVQMAISQEP